MFSRHWILGNWTVFTVWYFGGQVKKVPHILNRKYQSTYQGYHSVGMVFETKEKCLKMSNLENK